MPGERVRPGRHQAGPWHATDDEGLVALGTTEPADDRPNRAPDRQRKASLRSLWLGVQRSTEFEFQRLPTAVPELPHRRPPARAAGAFLDGSEHSYAASVSDPALTIWAYEELVHGVNRFRRLLGLTFLILLIVRAAHAAHP